MNLVARLIDLLVPRRTSATERAEEQWRRAEEQRNRIKAVTEDAWRRIEDQPGPVRGDLAALLAEARRAREGR